MKLEQSVGPIIYESPRIQQSGLDYKIQIRVARDGVQEQRHIWIDSEAKTATIDQWIIRPRGMRVPKHMYQVPITEETL